MILHSGILDEPMKQTRRQFVLTLGAISGAACGEDSDSNAGGNQADGGGGTSGNGGTGGGAAGNDAGVGGSAGGDGGPTGVGEGSPFGIATSHSRSLNLEWLGPIGATGITWLRGFDRGNADASLTTAEGFGFEVTGILQSGDTFPSAELTTWKDGIQALVSEAKGRVRHWEVWNEPPNFSTDKSPESYAAIVKSAYEAVKALDPSLEVGICAASVHLNFLAQAIAAGAADHFDYVTLHPYETLDLVDRGFEAQFMGIVPSVRKLLAALNPAKQWVPIVFTELGEPVDANHTPEHQTQTFLKAYVLSIAQGVTRVHWFEGIDGDSGPFGLLADDGTERPAYTAANTLIDELGALPQYVGWVLLNDQHYAFVFQGTRGPLLISWARPGTTPVVDLGGSVTIVDLATGQSQNGSTLTLDSAPRVARPIPEGLVTQAAANHSLPFPWGGDFSQVDEVSFAAPALEKGLHPASDAPTITIQGDPARDCGASAAQRFSVDPNFLSFDSAPIRVTAIVRRKGAQNAGFNLKYESVTGTSSAGGWNTIPAADQWHTFTWDVSDSQFVGKWGYHFALDSDATDNSQYALQSLSVTKL